MLHPISWLGGLAFASAVVGGAGCSDPAGTIVGTERRGGQTFSLDAELGYVVSAGRLKGDTDEFQNGTNISFEIDHDPDRVPGDIDLSLPDDTTGARASVQFKTDPDIEIGGFSIHRVDEGILRVDAVPTPDDPVYRGELIGLKTNDTLDYTIDATFELELPVDTVELFRQQ